MKRSLVYFFLFLFSISFVAAQKRKIDSLNKVLKTLADDTNKVNTFNLLSDKLWRTGDYDTALTLAGKALALAERLHYKMGQINALENSGCIYEFKSDYSRALECDKKALDIAKQTDSRFNIAYLLGDMGAVYYDEADYIHAIEYDMKAYVIDSEMGTKRSLAADFGNLGIIYHDQGNIPKALQYYLKALKIEEEIGSKRDIGALVGNIATVYYDEGNLDKALEYSNRALAIDKQAGDKNSIATALTNIGNAFHDKGSLSKSKEYYDSALAIYSEIGDMGGIALVLGNKGNTYDAEGNYKMALEYDYKALAMKREIGDKEGVAMNLANIGNIYCGQKNYSMATQYLDSSLSFSKEIGEVEDIRNAYSFKARLDSATGNFKTALEDYKKYINYRDSLVNEANTKKTVQEQMNYEFEQKQANEKAEQDKKDAIAMQEKNKQLVIRNTFIGGFILMLGLAFFIFRGYREKQKANVIIIQQKEEVENQKALVENQKALVEEKNKDILDSITYAKRLQDAILPPISLIKKYLPESFVLYKPKDIVAGDFYWVAPLPPQGGVSTTGSEISPLGSGGAGVLIAAADCTGHGVPGALVSVVCSNALNRTVKEFKITEPGKILDKVRELVLETFEKSESNVQDGMDISLCALTFPSPKREGVTNPMIESAITAATTDASLPFGRERVRVDWAGANNSLWYVLNARPDDPFGRGEMKEIVPDKQPIGKYYNAKPFTTNTFNIPKSSPLGSGGAVLYLFTDGYADQFGGTKGKKFMYRQLQQLIMDNAQLPMEEQKDILDREFENWKGNNEQTDDVCIIGIRI